VPLIFSNIKLKDYNVLYIISFSDTVCPIVHAVVDLIHQQKSALTSCSAMTTEKLTFFLGQTLFDSMAGILQWFSKNLCGQFYSIYLFAALFPKLVYKMERGNFRNNFALIVRNMLCTKIPLYIFKLSTWYIPKGLTFRCEIVQINGWWKIFSKKEYCRV
jgi:hypothetical protein